MSKHCEYGVFSSGRANVHPCGEPASAAWSWGDSLLFVCPDHDADLIEEDSYGTRVEMKMTPDQRTHLEDLIEAYAAVSVDEALDAPRSMVERSKAEIFEEIGALLDSVEESREPATTWSAAR